MLAMAAGLTTSAPAKELLPLLSTRSDGKTVVRFAATGTGTWTIPPGVNSVELLVVGGGGGGCGGPEITGGGGGGGGVYYNVAQAVTPGTATTVTIGCGGVGGASALAGGDSAFGPVLAKGGNPGTAAAGGASGAPTTHPGGVEMGGGGGAGEAGASPWHTNAKGGDGLRCTITGTSTRYAGGGGTMYSGPGGAGGGGAGSANVGIAGSDGLATKGGGGGGGRHGKGGNGGSGGVIVAYLLPGATLTSATTKPEGLAGQLDSCNVSWDSPGGTSSNSMPLGNGDIGLNAWVESNGDLVFYVSKTNAWDENARLCKVGRVRVKFDPPLSAATAFQQELKLRDGMIEITSEARDSELRLRLWVDANQPLVRLEAQSGIEVSCRAEVELWRLRERPFGPDDSHSGNGLGQLDFKATITPDVVVASPEPAVVWYHRNKRSIYDAVLKTENLGTLIGKFPDPLLSHTFGASLRGTGMVRDGAQAVKSSKPARRHELAVCVLAERTPTAAGWLQKLQQLERDAWRTHFEKARRETSAWWANFWNESWVFVDENPAATPRELSPVTQGYVLQRFIAAAAARGGSPVKFNGTIFTVPANPAAAPDSPDGDPDWRRWGGNYWFQNTRLVYWPLLATGNHEMMQPLFRMFKQALPLSMARTKACYKLENAAVFPETMYFWGLPNLGDYGLDNPGPEMASTYIRRHFNNGIELTALMLEYFNHTRDEAFVRDTLVPVAGPLIAFFEEHWPKRDAGGKIIFEPSQALETFQSVTNPLPDIAGLHYVLPRLLALPETTTTNEQRARWQRLFKLLPPIPMTEVDGNKVLCPAAEHGGASNFENPELYAVFPYKLFGVGSPDFATGRATFARRTNRQNKGWCKDSMQAACLGLGDEAGQLLAARARDVNKGAWFPAFWGPNFDWVPDQDHGSNILSTLQLMLLQYDTASPSDFSGKSGGKIFLLPAWPKNWNVSFKLHAPHNTTVEGEVRGGKLTFLKVTPQSRSADVVNLLETAK